MLRTANITRMTTGVAAAVLGGCAQIPLHANLSDVELRARLDEHFPAGMTVSGVQAELDVLKVPRGQRVFYPAGRAAGASAGGAPVGPSPAQLLARVFQPGGYWLSGEDYAVQWADLVFVFGEEKPEPLLARTETFRGRQRYWCGEPVNVPQTPTKYPWGRYPVMPPPPRDPPVGAGGEGA